MSRMLDSLLYMQGGKCFFCNQVLQLENASIEHLLAKSKGGNNARDNLVACCRTLNELFADMSLKEKMQVILNQKGAFCCPSKSTKAAEYSTTKPQAEADYLAYITTNLQKRGAAKPASLVALMNVIKSILPAHPPKTAADYYLQRLAETEKIRLFQGRVTYLFD